MNLKKMIRELVDRNKDFSINEVFYLVVRSISNLSKDELKEVCGKDFFKMEKKNIIR